MMLARDISHPCGARCDDKAERIDVARAIGLRFRLGEARHRREKLREETVRGLTARRQRNSGPISVFRKPPVPFERPPHLRERHVRIGDARIDLNSPHGR